MSRLNHPSSLITTVFAALDRHGVSYVLLRGLEQIKAGNGTHSGSDIDLLVGENQIDVCAALICRELQLLGFHSFAVPLYNGSVVRAAHAENPAARAIEFHVVAFVSLDTSYIHSRIRGYSRKLNINDIGTESATLFGHNVRVPSAVWNFALTYVQWTKKSGEDKYRKRLLQQLKSNPDLVQVLTDVSSPYKWQALTEFRGHANPKSQSWLAHVVRRLAGPATFGSSWARHAFCLRRALRNVFRPKGVFYFSGPDGSGKTTNVLELAALLCTLDVKFYRFRSRHVVTEHVIAVLQRFKAHLRGERVRSKDETQLALDTTPRDRDTGRIGWRIRRSVGLLAGLLDIIIAGRFRLLASRLRGRVAIVETAPVDAFVKRHRPALPFLEAIFIRMLPRSTSSFLMKADAQIIAVRKPELTIVELEEYYARVEPLIDRAKTGAFFLVPTNESPELSRDLIAKEVLAAISWPRAGAPKHVQSRTSVPN